MGACRFCIWRYCFRRLFFGIIKTGRGGKRYADDLQISRNQDLHQDELMENWELAQKKQELFEIEPLK